MGEIKMDRITLDCINIKNLFGRFDYEIDLRNGEDIAILIAPNGCGKTTIFSIVTFMLKPTYRGYRKVQRIPFDECECVLSNGNKLVLYSKERKAKKTSKNPNIYMEGFIFADRDEYDEISGLDRSESRELTLSIGTEKIPYSTLLNKILHDMDPESVMFFEENEASDIYYGGIHPRFRTDFMKLEEFSNSITDKLKAANSYVSVNFITADRLHLGNGVIRPERVKYRRMGYDVPMINDSPIRKAQKNTRNLIKQAREDCASLQTKVKDELPKQYLDVTDPLWDYEEFEEKWMHYVANIDKYTKVGLLDSAETILNTKRLKKYYDEKGAFLTVYLAAFAKTLEPLEKLYEKLTLFASIFNERNRITRKNIGYDKNGIVLKVNGDELSLEHLSSGEKNDFVMFYDLIFNSQENGLVLIDEPEISLHIEWQQTFLDSLIDICKMNGLQSIVATHSPNIIHGHRELFAEKGIEYGTEED